MAEPVDRRNGAAPDVLAALANRDRLRIFGAVAAATGGQTLAEVVEAVELDERLVQEAIGRLWQAGLLARENDRLVARADAIQAAGSELGADQPQLPARRPDALRRLCSPGRLTAIPANAGPRRE